ncbi:unnamed protein product [Cladocopium goreaui]|uniref:CHK kinase-like domain-containing protein n=1 Tax=Cladocopium goreaui TaxID=2562237 RepID=A0A9P1G1D7_9DINO|nr:unnamed protein product [Cladocopium goreaui]
MATSSLLAALQAKDGDKLRPALSKILKADVGPIHLEQSAGERFTGGTSTPVWKLRFVAKRGDKEKETHLVAKWVKPSTELRRGSYLNERQFYLSAGSVLRKVCRLPHLLMCDEGPAGIAFLFDDLTVDFPLHPDGLDRQQGHATLRWLARFHGSFWEADAAGSSFPAGMTTLADYWGLAKGDNEERLASVAGALNASSKVLKANGVWETAKTLGPRLAAAARPLDAVLRRTKGFVRHRTLLHGDFKTANLFLRDVEGVVEAAVVDFEFAGPGLVAVDLANFLFPDLKMNLLPMEGELLEFYHAELLKALDEFGTGSDFPLSTFLAQYTLARCDYMRYMLGRGWTACSAADAAIIHAVDKDLQHLDGGELLSSEGYAKAISDLLAKS